MRVVIQQKQGRFPNIHYFAAWMGFQELGCETILTETEEIPEYEVGLDSMVAGEIPVMLAAFQRAGVRYEHLRYIPAELERFAARRIWTSTLGEARASVASGKPVFVKPLEGAPRLFKGQVLREYRDLIRTAQFAAETAVWCSELVDFVSEHRVFVREGDVVGVQHYSGDFRRTIAWSVVDEALGTYANKPAGFAMDFGVTNDGRTLIVEQNDGFSLGAYGLHPVAYARLLQSRWLEILTGRRGQ
jgi:hypothetical protein